MGGIGYRFKRIEFVNEKMSYIALRGRWFMTVLNVHAPTEHKIY
jgi:hypothetical protein